MKIPFLSRSAPKGIGTCGCCSLAEPEPISYTTEFRDFIQKNAPLDFETKMARVRPFVFTSFIAWPAFWVYRGLDWSNKVHVERSLVAYINRTYHRAKFMQLAILSMGLIFAVYEQTPFFHQVSHMLKGSIDDVDEYTAQTRVID
ncbi:uncharacterized protein LOC129241473 isoform X2 [Anastrepha obliqua]|uniref:uncharacterized protein LOC129241473 isoform X2 n=1 Tax=Anastrepha obliqua TaxID=95512 RepID=UPI002408F541|nr:uncharacterized protein LOC129241473 isoform X2 [Anastrepha obliqua]